MQIGKEIVIKSIDDIYTVANEIIEQLEIGTGNEKASCLAFYGEMGAGKTTLIKAICKELGVKDTTSSPTFAIINEYVAKNSLPVHHFDFYRINSEFEAYDFGYEEYLYSGELCLIEWPEKIENLLPVPYIKIQILVENDERRKVVMSEVEQ